MTTRKDNILTAIETAIKTIIKGNTVTKPDGNTYTYQSTVTYTDRQYINVTENDILNRKMPWVIINNEAEQFGNLVGGFMENKVILHTVGFVKVIGDADKLDTMMNNLQKDILVAILIDETLGGNSDFLYPIEVNTVPTMVHPFGGFVISFEVTYSCGKLDM